MRYVTLFLVAFSLSVSVSVLATAKEDKYLAALSNQLNFREASSYAFHTNNRNIEIGVERIDKDGMKRLLGNNTKKYTPFDVAVTNNTKFRIYINQIVVSNANNHAYPKIDLSDVHDAIDPGGKGNKDDMRDAALRNNLFNKAMAHTILSPGETVQGIVFVKSKHLDEGALLLLQIQNMKRVAFMDFNAPLNK